ncbi:hypothetical protein [Levilactobacillus paucivorans]|nr:hypothetical protein [Levilactobacillus paucivorans]
MKTSRFMIGLVVVAFGMGMTDYATAQANTWHQGTPKVLRRTWFHNGKGDNKAYITYTKHRSSGNLFGYDNASHKYYRLPGYGLKNLKYQALGHHVYRLTGIQYSPKGSTVAFAGQRMTYKIRVTAKHLHFSKGYHDYGRHASFRTTKAPKGLY